MQGTDGNIREHRTNTAKEFFDLLSPEQSLFAQPCKLLYRGQANSTWKLEPSIFRPQNNPSQFLPSCFRSDCGNQIFTEFLYLESFVEHCDSIGLKIPNDSRDFRSIHLSRNNPQGFDHYIFNPNLWPKDSLFELMALAQHHGLPTRLLDWSTRSYVSAFFAASDALSKDSKDFSEDSRLAVWVFNTDLIGLYPKVEVVRVPNGNNANIAAQGGVFTVLRQKGQRGGPFTGPTSLDEYLLNKPNCPLMKVTVPVSEAKDILILCSKYAVTAATIFPDYYGAAKATIDSLRIGRVDR